VRILTKNLTISITDELERRMEKMPEVNWSEICRQAIDNYIKDRKMQFIRGLVDEEWWVAPLVYTWPGRERVWDEEVKAVNAMMDEIDEFPEWALQIRGAMPNRDGFEMCTHRWLDGLDHVIWEIGAEEFRPSKAGWCGDVPGRIVDAAEQRAAAVQKWVDRLVPPKNVLAKQVFDWLGEPTLEKTEAAHCYVDLVRAYFFQSHDHAKALSEQWRTRADKNDILKLIFEGEGFDGLLQNRCGFKIIDRLDLYIRIIGGDLSQLADRQGICNSQLRFIPKDDPARLEKTIGYLWGWQAYLLGKDEQWLRANKPELAGATIHALRGVSRKGDPTPLRRWLVASLLKSTKLWCQYALKVIPAESVPEYVRDLPDVVAGIEGSTRKV